MGLSEQTSYQKARARLLEIIYPVEDHEVSGLRNAIGRVLRTPVDARVDLPPADNSAMDGYALVVPVGESCLPEKAEFRVAQTIMAGERADQPLQNGEAARIMTGAMIPPGANTVVIQENVTTIADDRIQINRTVPLNNNIRRRGEDIRAESRLASTGTVISVPLVALLAAQGITDVLVNRRIRVALLATGDELRAAGSLLAPGQIYESNRDMVAGLLRDMPVELTDLGVLPDDEPRLTEALKDAAQTHDLVVSTGGVSVGEHDYTRKILEQQGQVEFWKIAMKPGKPLAFGRLFNAWFLGLPGNPVSALVTARLFLVPAVQRLTGLTQEPLFTFPARVAEPFKKVPGRADYQRATLARAADGTWEITPVAGQGSHQLAALAEANAFCCLPAESHGANAGEWVEAMPFGTEITGRV